MIEGYKQLAARIIQQALLDYRDALESGNRRYIREGERFLRSEWFHFLSDIDGERLIKRMRREFA